MKKKFAGQGPDDNGMIVIGNSVQKPSMFIEPIARKIDLYLSSDIGPPEEYTDWYQLIRTASELDLITIHINSEGGQVHTALQLVDAIEESNATIVGSVSGMCYSAATFIFLSCERWEISEHASFLFHNYRSGVIGKGGEMHDQITFERRWSESMIKAFYEGFLTTEEIKSILDGKDLWMSREDVGARFEAKNSAMEKKMKELDKQKKKEEADNKKKAKAPLVQEEETK
jgi:ATP-dependent protease ClpP protease subunit